MDSDQNTDGTEYQLVCEDREGLTANDGLLVVVSPRKTVSYSVEFNIAIGVPYENFVHSATMKRKFFEKLKEAFGDSNTDAIILARIDGTPGMGTTALTWHNQTLRNDICPEWEIQQLREILMDEKLAVTKKFGKYIFFLKFI